MSTTEKPNPFFKDWGALLIIALFLASIFYAMFIWDLPSPLSALAFFAGEGVLWGLIVWLFAGLSRHSIMDQRQEVEAQQAAELVPEALNWLPLPEPRIFLIRSALIVGGTLLMWGAIAVVVQGLVSLSPNRGTPNITPLEVMLIGGVILAGFLVGLTAFTAVPAFVDKYLYRQEAIYQTFYKPDDEAFNLWSMIKTLAKLILFAGVLIGLPFLSAFVDANSDAVPFPIWLALCGLVFGFMGWGLWGMWRSTGNITEDMEAQLLKDVAQTYGEESPEYEEFKLGMTRYQNSMSVQTANRGIRGMMVGLGVVFVLSLVWAVIVNALELSSNVGQGGLIVILLGMLVVLFWSLARGEIRTPEEFELIPAAINRGDYVAAKSYADALYAKLPPEEANLAVALAYGVGGEIDRAKQFCREAIKALMAVDSERRNKVLLANYLWLLGGLEAGQENHGEAMRLSEQALTYDAKHQGAHQQVAESLLYLGGDLEKAEYHLEKVFALNAEQQLPLITARMAKAWLLTKQGNFHQAETLMREVFEANDKTNIPVTASMYMMAGEVALARRATISAEQFFKRSLEVDPNGLVALMAKAALSRIQ